MNYKNILKPLLVNYIFSNLKGFHKKILKYKHIILYINKETKLLDIGNHSLSERLYWFLHDYQDYPHCKECGKQLIKFRRITVGYGKFCSMECTNKNKERRLNAMKTSLLHFGKGNGNNREKAKITMLNKYGKSYFISTNEFRQRSLHTVKQHYGENVTCVLQVQSIKQKIKQTNLKKYGTEYTSQAKEIQQKIKQTNLKKYGVEYGLSSKQVQEKIKQTNLKKYGVEYVSQVKEIQQKIKQTNLKKYGVEFPVQSHQLLKKARKSYIYNKIYFKNRWQLAVYKYCEDFNIQCVYQPDIYFEYMVNNKIRRYFPDFIINNKIIEIKGDYFFKIQNNETYMINPYDKTHVTDEIYQEKYKCMLRNNVQIWTFKNIKKYLIYIKETYGTSWFKQYKKR